MKLYHVAFLPLMPGAVIEPGNFGRCIQLHQIGSFMAHREAIYELVRAAEFPGKPSRLEGVFLLPTPEEAIQYRNEFAGLNLVYEIEVLEPGMSQHVAFIDLVCVQQQSQITVSQMYSYARAYWQSSDPMESPAKGRTVTINVPTITASPDASRPREILIKSPIRIVRRLQD